MNTTTLKPLLAAMLLALATSACQKTDDGMATTPTDDAATPPAAETMPEPAPPMQDMDPCAGLTGAQLDECNRRQMEQPAPTPVDPMQPTPVEPAPTETQDPPATTPPGGGLH